MKDSLARKKTDWTYGIFMAAILVSSCINMALCHAEETERLVIGNFSQGHVENWEKKLFNGESRYQLVPLDNQMVLEGQARNSSSGLFKKVRVDLTRTPFLNWSWRVEKPHPSLDERTKQGDDYAARIYIVVEGGLMFWKTIALNYVWSSSQPNESSWPSAYAGKNVMLMALRSTGDRVSKWYHEKRNVYDDFKRLFDREITQIDGVAIMTDSDDSRGDVLAYYGDIFFTAN